MTSLPALLPARSGLPDVVAFGENSLDFIGVLDGAPAALAAKRALGAFLVLPGGQMATAAAGCARLGCRTRYVGVFGDDAWGREARAALSEQDVEVIAIEKKGIASRTAIVLVDRHTGERAVFERRDPQLALADAELPLDRLVEGRVLLLDATDLHASTRAAKRARAAGVRTVVDVDRVAPGIDDLLDAVDVLILPESFAHARVSETSIDAVLAALDQRFPGKVIAVTRGAAGVDALAGGQRFSVSGHSRGDVSVVDTTGAGDAFRAGFVSKWLKGGADARIEAVLAYANAAAYLNCRARGAQAGLPTDSEVCALLTTTHGR